MGPAGSPLPPTDASLMPLPVGSELVARQMRGEFPPSRASLRAHSGYQGSSVRCFYLPPTPPLLGFLYSSRSVRFLKDTWETTVSYGTCHSVRCFYWLGFTLRPFFEYLSLYTSPRTSPHFLKIIVLSRVPVPCCTFNVLGDNFSYLNISF